MEKPRSIFLFSLVLAVTCALLLMSCGCGRRQLPPEAVKVFKAKCLQAGGEASVIYNDDMTVNQTRCVKKWVPLT